MVRQKVLHHLFGTGYDERPIAVVDDSQTQRLRLIWRQRTQ
jgi:hypothetical protein